MKSYIKEIVTSGRWVHYLTLGLVLVYALSFLAPHHWVFDFLVNFKIQYFTGAVVLLAFALFYRFLRFAAGLALLSILLILDMQMVYAVPFSSKPDRESNFTIVQYNKLYDNDNYDPIYAWLRDPKNTYDVVVVNESIRTTINPLKELKDIYPHQSPESIKKRFGDITILSRWPITATPITLYPGRPFDGTKFTVWKPGLEPITVYAHHAQIPRARAGHDQRFHELDIVAKAARDGIAGGERNVLMMGDWNTTPWSPTFRHVVKTSGLNYQQFGWLPVVTWPSFTALPFLQVPIDHIIFDNSLTLTDIRQGPSLGSDHHSLIAAFWVNPAE